MGTSTDAILFWGIAFDDEEKPWPEELAAELDQDGADDWENVYALTQGVRPPAVEYSAKTKAKWSRYWKAARASAEASGCKVGTHCGGECPMYYLTVSESEMTAYRGYPKEVSGLTVKDGWRERLEAFCRALKIPWREPKWWLVSYWSF